MQLTVTGRHVEVTEAMKEHARLKLERIALDCPRILGAHLIMDIEKYRHRAEVVLQGPHLTITCSRETSDMYGSIDQVMHCVEGQLKRYKDRIQAHKPRHAREVRAPLGIMEVGEHASSSVIVRAETIAVKPMHLDEAILQMDLAQFNFLVFLDAVSGRRDLLIRLGEDVFGYHDWNKTKLKGTRLLARMKVFSSEGLEELGSHPRHLRDEKVSIDVLHPGEARERLVASGRNFMLFHNGESGESSILFELRRGGFGLIQASGEQTA
ncbi:MAG: ribosome-associated translation inhibitor RaiA [Candidatus Tritonobacter lacicola]|nr:ribosome-associated translation inhibitor RaiA [Candidatus Tritonobacter lacicola]